MGVLFFFLRVFEGSGGEGQSSSQEANTREGHKFFKMTIFQHPHACVCCRLFVQMTMAIMKQERYWEGGSAGNDRFDVFEKSGD